MYAMRIHVDPSRSHPAFLLLLLLLPILGRSIELPALSELEAFEQRRRAAAAALAHRAPHIAVALLVLLALRQYARWLRKPHTEAIQALAIANPATSSVVCGPSGKLACRIKGLNRRRQQKPQVTAGK